MTSAENGPPWATDIPVLRPEHLLNAQLYADRLHMIAHLGPQKLQSVAELGVALGDFSKSLIERYNPDIFYAIDIFTLHEYEMLWNQETSKLLEGRTHCEAYLHRMQPYRNQLLIKQGDGADELAKLPDASIDLIYIDGSHHYANVVRDCAAAHRKVKPGGLLIFNDYTIWSHFERMWYGVVPVVNDLLVNKGGKVVGFALHPNMYADIAIQM
jgi:hypothetical protein